VQNGVDGHLRDRAPATPEYLEQDQMHKPRRQDAVLVVCRDQSMPRQRALEPRFVEPRGVTIPLVPEWNGGDHDRYQNEFCEKDGRATYSEANEPTLITRQAAFRYARHPHYRLRRTFQSASVSAYHFIRRSFRRVPAHERILSSNTAQENCPVPSPTFQPGSGSPTMRRPALFLDRDGVVNYDRGYVHRKEDFIFVAGIFDLVRAANAAGYLCIIATNQSGIGRGLYTEAAFNYLMAWVADQFMQQGGIIHAVYFCPNHPEHGRGAYRIKCQFRKPAPGMLLQAAAEWQVDLPRSILVGDNLSDIEAGSNAGVGRNVLFSRSDAAAGAIDVVRDLTELVSYFTPLSGIRSSRQ
jgi:D-glycero-D-manno-heptose 1,7-bisphosphate phosphatase